MVDVVACILAGGRGRRLGGRQKSLIEIDGTPILERQLDVLAPRVRQVLLAIAPAAPALPVPARWATRVSTVADDAEDAGPLAGIAVALAACTAPWLLVVAGDLPWLQPGLIDALLAAASHDADDLDAIAPRVAGLPEPLLALYAARLAPIAARRLADGRRKASGLLTDEGLRVRWLDEPALRAADPALASFRDVDTPADLQLS